jgi:hypothetical protein
MFIRRIIMDNGRNVTVTSGNHRINLPARWTSNPKIVKGARQIIIITSKPTVAAIWEEITTGVAVAAPVLPAAEEAEGGRKRPG